MSTTTKPQAVIWDMDGTLVDSRSRLHMADPRHPEFIGEVDLDLFHSGSAHLPAHGWALALARSHVTVGLNIVIMTSRSERYRPQAEYWLARNDVSYVKIFMRADDDEAPDSESKGRTLDLVQAEFEVVSAVDDNPYVIALLEARGIHVTVAPGWPHPVDLPEII